MPQSLLQQLSEMTIVVADTGDINAIRKFKPRDATTNPSLIMAAAQMKEYAPLVDDALGWAKKDAGADGDQGRRRPARDRSPQRRVRPAHPRDRRRAASRPRSTRASRSTRRARSRRPARSSSSTRPPGRRASASSSRSPPRGKASARPRCSSSEGIHCNLTLLFGLHQAIACAEAGVTLISPFVGPDPRLVQEVDGQDGYEAARGPGRALGHPHLQLLQALRLQDAGHGGELPQPRARSPSSPGAISSTIAPNYLEELSKSRRRSAAQARPGEGARRSTIERIAMDEATFRKMHAADKMASDKLEEGIQGFTKAMVALEKLLGESSRLTRHRPSRVGTTGSSTRRIDGASRRRYCW